MKLWKNLWIIRNKRLSLCRLWCFNQFLLMHNHDFGLFSSLGSGRFFHLLCHNGGEWILSLSFDWHQRRVGRLEESQCRGQLWPRVGQSIISFTKHTNWSAYDNNRTQWNRPIREWQQTLATETKVTESQDWFGSVFPVGSLRQGDVIPKNKFVSFMNQVFSSLNCTLIRVKLTPRKDYKVNTLDNSLKL